MKKRISVCLLILTMSLCFVSGCASKEEKSAQKPELVQVRNICNLATLECYYHNVSTSTIKKGTGFLHIGEKDRKLWIQYRGIVKCGIDMSKVTMEIDGNNVTVTLPPAEVMDITIDRDSLDDSSFLTSEDGWNKNRITADDQTAAIDAAQKEMEETARKDTALLASAQERARELIENYIKQIGSAGDVEYNIQWKYLNGDSDSNTLTETEEITAEQ